MLAAGFCNDLYLQSNGFFVFLVAENFYHKWILFYEMPFQYQKDCVFFPSFSHYYYTGFHWPNFHTFNNCCISGGQFYLIIGYFSLHILLGMLLLLLYLHIVEVFVAIITRDIGLQFSFFPPLSSFDICYSELIKWNGKFLFFILQYSGRKCLQLVLSSNVW